MDLELPHSSIREKFTPTMLKPEGFRVKASEGEVVALYPVAAKLEERSLKGKQHGEIETILGYHRERYPG